MKALASRAAGATAATAARRLGRGGSFFTLLLLVPLLGPRHWVMNMLVFTLMYATMSSAWNLVGGYAGYPSLGHAAFFGIGAYSVGLLFKNAHLGSGYEPFLALPLIGLLAALIGWPIGAVSMRTRADVFAIVTITFLFVVQTLAFNLRSLTGGSQGLALPVAPFAAASFERPFYYVLVALLAIAMGLSHATARSKIGLSLVSIRADEDKARGIGVRVTGVKLLAFCVSVGLTAMVGAVWAYYESFVYPQFAIDPLITISVVLMTFLGGRATLWGPVIGAFILETGQQYLAYRLGASQFYLIAYALIFLLVIVFLPRGILPTIAERARRRRRRRRSAAAAAGVAGSAAAADTADAADPTAAGPDGAARGWAAVTDLLAVGGLTKAFGGVRAVDDCSLAVAEGTITGLIGPNGSGKTTLFNLVTGYLRPDAGHVVFARADVTGNDPGRLYRRGLSRTFQQARVFPALTVEENLVVAAGYGWRQLFTRRVGDADRARAGELLAEFRLTAVADLPAGELSYGQRKLLEFAAVLMSAPRLILLDEPTAGVNPVLIEAMERRIRERNAAGITFLVVEHDMTFVMRLCDPVVVLDAGRVIFSGPPAEVQRNSLVLDAYLGA